MSVEHLDVLIVGAGISGIGAAYYLQDRCPSRRYAILESRDDLGGTWDLFRYPGVRSDSDMHTLGYSFKPWNRTEAIAEGPAILKYLRETAREFGIDRHIRFGQRVRSASWSTAQACWTVEAEVGELRKPVCYTCNFLFLCSGYYDYERGYLPAFTGQEEFRGKLVHPQHWPTDLDHRGQSVVVIGSGATAVTLVPALAEVAKHVTMLQRSPSYILSIPAEDGLAACFVGSCPGGSLTLSSDGRICSCPWRSINSAVGNPGGRSGSCAGGVARELPPGVEMDVHFKPSYEPWDQRLCLVPDGDLFRAMRAGRVSVITDELKTFTPHGILLKSGRELTADIIVAATGLNLQAFGGISLKVDGADIESGQCLVYKGLMLRDVPNCAFCAGYTNASWTLRAELSAKYVCRLLRCMDRHEYTQCVPRCDLDSVRVRPLLPLMSGYIKRGADAIPKQGSTRPWVTHQNYLLDLLSLRLGRVEDGVLEFSRSGPPLTPHTSGFVEVP